MRTIACVRPRLAAAPRDLVCQAAPPRTLQHLPEAVTLRERARTHTSNVVGQLRGRGEIEGLGKYESVGKSQPLLSMIDPIISPRTRRKQEAAGSGQLGRTGRKLAAAHAEHERGAGRV
eukprot:COSAG01_NODE_1689_length_9488_cov_5.759825_6_plen_119_part_00